MKNIKLLILGISLLFAGTVSSQINITIGSPPQWGPSGYNNVQYYYLPDVHAYYDVPSSQFIYLEGNSWVHRKHLPTQYRNYDLYNGYKVVLTDYRGKTPYVHFKNHKVKYAKGYRGNPQKTIGMKPGNGNKAKYSPGKSSKGNAKSSGSYKGSNNKGGKSAKGNGGGKGNKK